MSLYGLYYPPTNRRGRGACIKIIYIKHSQTPTESGFFYGKPMNDTKELLQPTLPADPRPAVMWQVKQISRDKNQTLTIKFPASKKEIEKDQFNKK